MNCRELDEIVRKNYQQWTADFHQVSSDLNAFSLEVSFWMKLLYLLLLWHVPDSNWGTNSISIRTINDLYVYCHYLRVFWVLALPSVSLSFFFDWKHSKKDYFHLIKTFQEVWIPPSLEFFHCRLTTSEVKLLAQTFIQQWFPLKFWLGYCSGSSNEMISIIMRTITKPWFQKNAELSFLKTEVWPKWARSIARAIGKRGFAEWMRLDLDGCWIGNEGFNYLLEAIKVRGFSERVWISLEFNNIWYEWWMELLYTLRKVWLKPWVRISIDLNSIPKKVRRLLEEEVRRQWYDPQEILS